jgi:hypothetical protein
MGYILFIAGIWVGVSAALVAHDIFQEVCHWGARRRAATDLTSSLARAWVAQDRKAN